MEGDGKQRRRIDEQQEMGGNWHLAGDGSQEKNVCLHMYWRDLAFSLDMQAALTGCASLDAGP